MVLHAASCRVIVSNFFLFVLFFARFILTERLRTQNPQSERWGWGGLFSAEKTRMTETQCVKQIVSSYLAQEYLLFYLTERRPVELSGGWLVEFEGPNFTLAHHI